MPGHHGGSSSSSSSSSTNQGPAGGQSSGGNYSGGGGGGDSGNARESYGAGGQYQQTTTPSAPSVSVGGGDSGVDVGFQEALRQQAIRQADPVYGDPDPQVDVAPQDRDSITSFKDNYIANVKSNPMYLGIGGLLHTAYQTGKAKSMLSGVPGYEFLDYSDGNNNVPTIAGGGGENTTALLAASPYLVSGDTQVESEASKWYNSIGNNTKQFNFASAYATAKEKVSQTLNNKGPIGMLAVSDSPYYDWLKTNKLDRGIL
jgi:hypothetical protein